MSDRYILARDYANARGLSVDAFISQLMTLEKKIQARPKTFRFSLYYGAFEKRFTKERLRKQYFINDDLIYARLKARAELIDIIYALDARYRYLAGTPRRSWRSEFVSDYIAYKKNSKKSFSRKDFERYYMRAYSLLSNFYFCNLELLQFFDKWLLEFHNFKWQGARAWYSQFVDFNDE
nr:MAG TPA: hypothetical protein [Caudoviricetes sp.]